MNGVSIEAPNEVVSIYVNSLARALRRAEFMLHVVRTTVMMSFAMFTSHHGGKFGNSNRLLGLELSFFLLLLQSFSYCISIEPFQPVFHIATESCPHASLCKIYVSMAAQYGFGRARERERERSYRKSEEKIIIIKQVDFNFNFVWIHHVYIHIQILLRCAATVVYIVVLTMVWNLANSTGHT